MRKVKVTRKTTKDGVTSTIEDFGLCHGIDIKTNSIVVEYNDGSIKNVPFWAITFLDKPEEDNNQLRNIVTQLVAGHMAYNKLSGARNYHIGEAVNIAKEIIRQTS